MGEFHLSMLDGRVLDAEDFHATVIAVSTQPYGVVVETTRDVFTYPWQSIESISISK